MPPLLAAAFVVLFEVFSVGAIYPVLHDYCEKLSLASPAIVSLWTGMLFAIGVAPRIIMNTVWGKLSDHHGRKPVLILITLGTLLGSVLWALAGTLGAIVGGGMLWLTASRAVTGVFQAQAVVVQTIAADVSKPEKRAAAMGILGAAFGLGILGGIVLGGIVSHFSLAAVGWATAASQLCSLMLIISLLRETHPHHLADSTTKSAEPIVQARQFRHVLHQPGMLHLLLTLVIMTIGQMVLIPTLRLVTDQWYQLSREQTAAIFFAWCFIGVFVQGGVIRPLVRRVGERHTIILGLVLQAIGLIILGLHLQLGEFWTGLIIVAFGTGLTTPAFSSLLSLQTPSSEQGTVQGLNQSATSLGRALSYAMAGLLNWKLGPAATFIVAATLTLIAWLFLIARRSSRQTLPPHPASPAP